MTEAVTPPNPDQSDSGRHGNPPQSVPDPTLMTIDALRREIAMLESLTDAKLMAAENLTVERIARIDVLMAHIADARREQKEDTKAAVDAALDAQKESTAKMERSMADQLHALTANFETSHRGIQSSIDDLKDRVTVLESIKQGVVQQKSESRQVTAGQIAAIGVGVTVILAILTVISFIAGGA